LKLAPRPIHAAIIRAFYNKRISVVFLPPRRAKISTILDMARTPARRQRFA
jgi:hypothetical protein